MIYYTYLCDACNSSSQEKRGWFSIKILLTSRSFLFLHIFILFDLMEKLNLLRNLQVFFYTTKMRKMFLGKFLKFLGNYNFKEIALCDFINALAPLDISNRIR